LLGAHLERAWLARIAVRVPELDPAAVGGANLFAAGEGRDAEYGVVIRLGARIGRWLVTRRVVLLLVLSVVLVGG
jgi:hypothetical protein